MNTINIIILILVGISLVFFIMGHAMNSVKHVGIGGTLLSIAMICLILLK